MNFQILQQGESTLLAAPELIEHITPSWFDLNWWRSQGQQIESAPGRGESYFLAYKQWSMVWRHYKRGGLAAKLSQDGYLWTGLESTRAYAEFVLTQQLLELNLPVPRPLAGHVIRQGLNYRADLITERIPNACSLADAIASDSEIPWQQVGATIARFHRAGLDHVDLNLRNILLNRAGEVFLIDFDRCRMRSIEEDWQNANLDRLQRSLNKLFPGQDHAGLWQLLLQGYQG